MVYVKMVNSGIWITLYYPKKAHIIYMFNALFNLRFSAQLSHSQPQRANCGPAASKVEIPLLSIYLSIHPSIHLSIYQIEIFFLYAALG